jgi:hypothetical protein
MLPAAILLLIPGIALFAQQSCPATTNNVAFTPPAPYAALPGGPGFLYGTRELWTYVETPMHATDGSRLSAKLVYWSPGFNWKAESLPDLKVIAKRLDAPAPLIETPIAHGVRFNDEEIPANMAMMTGIEIPDPGCWQIVATYKGIHTLSYIVSVIR